MINQIIDDLIDQGSNIKDRQYLIDNATKIIENNYSEQFIDKLKKFIQKKMNEINIKNISIGIKIDDYQLIINQGNADFDNSLYDIASITKLFTLKLCHELNKENVLDYNLTIKQILPEFKYLDDLKIDDILKMHYFIETDGKLSETNTKEEFYTKLKTARIKDYNKSLYTDIGFNILPLVLETLYEKKFQQKLTFEQLCYKYIFDVYNLKNTKFNHDTHQSLGNCQYDLPSDKKAQILDGVSGAAGIFSNINDLFIVADLFYKNEFFNPNFIKEIYNYYFLDTKKRKRSYAGLYLYTEDYYTYVPHIYSKYTIAHQGYTGSTIAFDLKNNINQIILVDALDKNNKKHDNFLLKYQQLQERISLDSLVLYIVNKIITVK